MNENDNNLFENTYGASKEKEMRPSGEIPNGNDFSDINKGYTVTPDGNFFGDAFKTEKPNTENVSNDTNGTGYDQKPDLNTATFGNEDHRNDRMSNPDTSENEGYYHGGYYHYAYKKTTPPVKEIKPKAKRSYGLGVVVAAVVLAAIIGAGAASAVFGLKYKGGTNTVTVTKDGSQTTINVDQTASSVIEAVAEKAGPSVVGIRTTTAYVNFFGGSSESTGEGSGVVYTTDGYIITNYHVIESVVESYSSGKIDVYLNNDSTVSYPAKIIGYNISYDLAVIKVENANLTSVEIGKSEDVKVGQFVAAIGCPGGLAFLGSVSYGVVSGLNRVTNASSQETVALIQTDAAINPGNSGGALLNIQGQLIGINSSKIASTEYEGMGFAIPVDTVTKICDNIIAKKDQPTPYTGITLSETYSKEILNQLGYPAGAVVSAVAEGSPAQKAGIRRGDIITEWDGSKITNYDGLVSKINDCKVGQSVTAKIYRSGRYYTATVKITSNNAK